MDTYLKSWINIIEIYNHIKDSSNNPNIESPPAINIDTRDFSGIFFSEDTVPKLEILNLISYDDKEILSKQHTLLECLEAMCNLYKNSGGDGTWRFIFFKKYPYWSKYMLIVKNSILFPEHNFIDSTDSTDGYSIVIREGFSKSKSGDELMNVVVIPLDSVNNQRYETDYEKERLTFIQK